MGVGLTTHGLPRTCNTTQSTVRQAVPERARGIGHAHGHAAAGIYVCAYMCSEAAARPAEFIVVLSRQRSSSTVLSQAIAAFHPCVVWTNEIFHTKAAARLRRECGTMDRFSGRLLREHGKAALHASRFSHPVAFLRAVRDLQLSVQWPRPGCGRTAYALVFKLFDMHLNGRLETTGLQDLLSYPRTSVLVLERDAAASECSLSWARRSADWCRGLLPHASNVMCARPASYRTRPTPRVRQGRHAFEALGRVRRLPVEVLCGHAVANLSSGARGLVRARAPIAPPAAQAVSRRHVQREHARAHAPARAGLRARQPARSAFGKT